MPNALKILFVTLEFSAGTFSGNGIYAQDQVHSLSKLGHRVFVVSARPVSYTRVSDSRGAVALIEVPVLKWGRLDHGSPWEEFCSKIEGEVLQRVVAFAPDVIVCVDWSAFPVCNRIRQYFGEAMLPPIVWSSYRIHTRTAADENSRKLLHEFEIKCLHVAEAAIVMSPSDQRFVLETFATNGRHCRAVHVLAPHLRQDFVSIPPLNPLTLKDSSSHCAEDSENRGPATSACWMSHLYDIEGWIASRQYFTCCVRLSPEKEPERFVEIVEEMQRRNLFQKHGLRPLMCGSFKTDYAQRLKSRIVTAVPESVIVDRFIGPKEMTEYFSQTRINIHPCVYDAYGMTVVEAASQEVPSIVHVGDGVGASDFLRSQDMQIVQLDLHQDLGVIVDCIEIILNDAVTLAEVAVRASKRALQFTAKENAEKLVEILESVI